MALTSTRLAPLPTPSSIQPISTLSGDDYSFLCSKPCKETDREETIKNYEQEEFARREALLNDLPNKLRLIDEGLSTFALSPCIGHEVNRAKAVEQGLLLLHQAHGRSSHLESVIQARLACVINSPALVMTRVLVDVLMCPSGSQYYNDKSPTMDILRPYLTAVRKGIQ
jgi:hypothetical protein